MGVVTKVAHKLDDFYRQMVVCEQYPMLSTINRKELQRNDAIGLVYMLHHVVDKDARRIPTNEDLKISPEFLEKIILSYKRRGFDFVSLDQMYEILSSESKPKRPFVSFTIDDGYLDNYTIALPVFERHKVPFAVFVATDFIDNKAILWWDSVEDLLLANDEVTTSDGQKYPSKTFQQRWDTFRHLREKILSLNHEYLEEELNDLFRNYQIDWHAPIQRQSMSWQQVKKMAENPLCTIGGHTISHPALSKLSAEKAKYEIVEGIRRIEQKIQQKVCYFAYPFGTCKEIGKREREIMSSLSVRFAFMAHEGCIKWKNRFDATHLPRVYLHESSFPIIPCF